MQAFFPLRACPIRSEDEGMSFQTCLSRMIPVYRENRESGIQVNKPDESDVLTSLVEKNIQFLKNGVYFCSLAHLY